MNLRKLSFLAIALAVLAAGLAVAWRQTRHPPALVEARAIRLQWVFEASHPGFVVAAPLVSQEGIFLAAGHRSGFQSWGAIYAIDPQSGKLRWTFDRGGELLPTASTPLLDGERLLIGEGLHNNFACRLQCLEARTGEPRWSVPTGDHIEGGPASANGSIIFPAGNDGLYAVEAETGKLRWNFNAGLHIDSTPWIDGNRLFVGSGPSRRFNALEVVCLETKTGTPQWRTPVKIPAWGSPRASEGRVFVGLGNGRLTQAAQPPEQPAGALACFDADSGAERWTFAVRDAVFGRPAVAGGRVAFGSRDGNLYGVTFDGAEAFRLPLGSPVMASAAASEGLVYAASLGGRIVCANPADGKELWRYELSDRGNPAEVYSAPVVSGNRLFVVGEMKVGQIGYVCLHCFELP